MTVAPDEVRRRPVGVFDSGVGGLTVLHELLVRLPHEDYRLPRRLRAAAVRRRARPSELRGFALEVAEELLAPRDQAARRRVQLGDRGGAARAARAADADDARRRGARRRPARRRAGGRGHAARQGRRARHAGDGRDRRLRAAIAAIDPFVEVVSVPCGDLAMRIEDGDDRRARSSRRCAATARRCARRASTRVILGCTHYPLVRPIIQRMLGPETAIVTSGAPLARQVEHVLGTRGLDSPRRRRGPLRLPLHGRAGRVPRAGHALPAAAARRGRAGCALGAAVGRGAWRHDRARASAAAAARPASCGRSRSSPASCRPRPAPC